MKSRPPASRRIWLALAAIEGFEEGCSIFSEDDDDRAWFVDGKQVANFRRDGTLELRLTRKRISEHRAQLKSRSDVVLRRSGSDWIGIRMTPDLDIAFALELAEIAAAAHRPPPGVPPKPPPMGVELARRRRFH
jgi:hypothetical protein